MVPTSLIVLYCEVWTVDSLIVYYGSIVQSGSGNIVQLGHFVDSAMLAYFKTEDAWVSTPSLFTQQLFTLEQIIVYFRMFTLGHV